MRIEAAVERKDAGARLAAGCTEGGVSRRDEAEEASLMSSTLVQTATALLTPDIVSRASSQLGEPEDSVGKALSRGAVPTLLAGLAAKTQERGGAERIVALLGDPAFDPRNARNPAALFAEGGTGASLRELGGRLLALLFGGRLDSLTTALAEFAGIRPSSSSSLLRVAAPLLLGVVGDRVRRDGLDAAGLTRLFAGERDSILNSVPSTLRNAIGPAPARAEVAPASVGAPRWLWPALALLALALLWTMLRGRDEPPATAMRPAAELPDVAAQRPVDWVTRRLPSGTELRIPSNGIEVRLVGLLEGRGDSDEWFEFDRLLFETGSANLRPESQEQLRNVAAILMAYPNTQAKIGGYTDNTGDPAANLRLSQERAANVKSSLVNLGVNGNRLEAEGYGEQHPVASNATETGRAQNRRIAMRLSQP
jgi:outer membrane protein OmpA-like peptidoglycan-associated protein